MYNYYSRAVYNQEQVMMARVRYSQNTPISLEYIHFWTKIYLTLYPSLGNLITHITILLTIAVGPNRHDYSIDWSDDKL